MKKLFIIGSIAVSTALFALPQGSQVVAGRAEIDVVGENHLRMQTSDKAIINHRSFNIAQGERLEFVQPTDKSVVLNRVIGEDLSAIYGSLTSNGKVFLINPNGILFGPNAMINTGSFLASTLDISDEDFLNDRYKFMLNQRSKKSKIANLGHLEANPEGFIALFAPYIENRGSILATAGRVVLASAEKVTLDFSGDGLLQFAVEGELKDALIENYGKIQAADGKVDLSMRAACKAIKMVVNTEGAVAANGIEESNGVIRLVATSHLAASEINVDAGLKGKLEVSGDVDASNLAKGASGGVVRLLGDALSVFGANVNASGDAHGGEVLVGGNYQGKGKEHNATTTIIDNESKIIADCISEGDGGKVIVWSDDTTLFDGKIFARGGVLKGDGGFVETSGKDHLGMLTGYVDTSAPSGKYGTWLLDPNNLTIILGSGGTFPITNCSSGVNSSIGATLIANAASNALICAQRNPNSSITISAPITMANPNISLTFTAGSASAGAINVNSNLTTKGGAITFNGLVNVGPSVTLDTTNAGGSPLGANINFSNTVNGANTLTLSSGSTGIISFNGSVGSTTPLTNLTFSSAGLIQVGSNIRVTGANPLNFSKPVSLTGPCTITTTNNNITFGSTLNGGQNLTVASGTGTVAFAGAVGGSAPLTNLTFSSAGLIQVGSNIRVTGANPLNFSQPVSLTGPSTITTTNNNITFGSTLNGGQNLTVASGTGTVAFAGVVGGVTPLTSLSASGAVVTQNLSSKTTGALSYTGSSGINLQGNVTTSGAVVSMTGPVTLSNSPTIDTTNTGASPLGANINFSSTVNGASSLTLAAGTAGNINFLAGVGAGLTSLTISSVNNLTLQNLSIGSFLQSAGSGTTTFNGIANFTGASGFSFTGNNLVVNNAISTALASSGGASVNVAGTFTLGSSGSFNLDGTFVQAGTGQTQSSGSITTNNKNIQFQKRLTLTGNTALNSGSGAGDILLNSVEGPGGLTLTAGTGNITFSAVIGAITNVGAFLVNSCTNITTAALTASSATITSSGLATLTGNYTTTGVGGIQIVGQTITRSGDVTTTGGGGCTFTNSGLLTSTGNYTLSGSFLQNGTGSSTLAGVVTVNSGNISFLQVLQLSADVTLSTLVGGGNITLSEIVNGTTSGGQNFTLTSGSGNITLSKSLGATTSLGAFKINTASTVLASQSITATSISQLAGTLSTTFNGALSASGALGINLAGTAFNINNNVNTTGSGPFSATNSGLLTIGPSATLNIADSFSQNGIGAIALSGNVTATKAISFAKAITVGGSASLTTTSEGITLSSTVDGGGNLTLNSGASDILIVGNIGATNSLGNFIVVNANNVTTQSVKASTITQQAGGGLSSFGVLTTTGAINVTGNNFTFTGNVTTGSGGNVTIANTGTCSINPLVVFTLGGQFSQTSGPVNLQGSINTTNQPISFGGAVTLQGNATLASSNGTITLSNTVDSLVSGLFGLNITVGTGAVNCVGNLGSATRLGALTINSCQSFSAQGLTLASMNINQTFGIGGSIIFNGNINTNAPAGIVLQAKSISRAGTLNASNGGPFNATFSGSLTVTNFTPITVGSLEVINTGVGGIDFGISVIATTGGIYYDTPMNLVAPASFDTSAAGGAIHFIHSINSLTQQDVTFNAGTGNILFDADLGNTYSLGNLKIIDANNVTTQAISANSVQQLAGTGLSSFNGAITATGVIPSITAGISIATANILRGAALSATNGGISFTLNAGGILISTAAGNIVAQGSFLQNVASGVASVQLGGNITTTSGDITFSSPTTLFGDVNLNASTNNYNVTVNTIDGNYNLVFDAGSGNVTATGAIGAVTRVKALTVTSCTDLTVLGIKAESIAITKSFGTMSLNGDLNTNQLDGIVFADAHNISRSGSITATNGGPFNVTFDGSLTVSNTQPLLAGSVSVVNTGVQGINFGISVIATTGGIYYDTPMNLVAPASFDTSAAGGAIRFIHSINSLTHQDVTFNAGAGNVLFDADLGLSNYLGNITIVNANNVTTQAITAKSILQQGGTGLTYFNGAINTNTILGLSLTASAVTFNQVVSTSSGGSVLINHIGLLTMPLTATMTLSGSFYELGGGDVNMGNSMTTTNQLMTFADEITLTGNVILTSGGGNITFDKTIEGHQSLNVNAGAGTIIFSDALGLSNPLSQITATAGTIQQDSSVSTTGEVTYDGSMILGGSITTQSGKLTLEGGNAVLTNSINLITGTNPTEGADILVTGTLNGDLLGRDLVINAGGLGKVDLEGTFGGLVRLNNFKIDAQEIIWGALGSTSLGATGNLTLTSLSSITFNGVSYSNGVQNYTGTEYIFIGPTSITSNNQAITFNGGNIQLQAGSNLTITSNGGNVTLNTLTVADNGGTNLTIDANTGNIYYIQIGTSSNKLNDVVFICSNCPVPSSNIYCNTFNCYLPGTEVITTDQISPGSALTYTNPISFGGGQNSILFTTCPGGAAITFEKTLDSSDTMTYDIVIEACNYPVSFLAPVGGIHPLGSITINNPSDVHINSTMNTGSLKIVNASGTVTSLASIDTTTSSGIDIEALKISISGGLTTLNSGGVNLINSGALTVSSAAFDCAGAFTQTGLGAVSMAGAIQTHDQPISFQGPFTLQGNVLLTSKYASGGAITFADSVDGAYNLTCSSGSEAVTFQQAVGNTTPLNILKFTTGDVVADHIVKAASITQLAGAVKTTFNDAITTTTLAGISLKGIAFEIDGLITTTGGGSFVIENTALAELNESALVAANFTQTGVGALSMGGDFSIGGILSLSSPITLNAATIFDTSSNNTNMFLSSINGSHNLTLKANNGNITVGDLSGLDNLTITSVNNFTGSIALAKSITQANGVGTTSFTNMTSTTSGIALTGNAFTINGNIISAGSVAIENSGSLNLFLAGSTNISGAFSQSGGGPVNLSGTLTTVNQPITLTNAIALINNASLQSGGGDIQILNTINGNSNLTLDAGSSGTISLGGSLGQATPLNVLTLQNFTDVSYPTTTAVSIIQTGCGGITTIDTTITSLGVGGISLSGLTFNQTGILTSVVGPISINNGAFYTMQGAINSGSGFTQLGGGSTQLGGSIVTTTGSVTFTNPIILQGLSSLSTNGGSGNISILDSINGNYDLSLLAGLGTISFSNRLGSLSSLGNLSIISGNVNTTQSIKANSLKQLSGAGTYRELTTLSDQGVQLTGSTFTLAGTIDTSVGSGVISIVNAQNVALTGSLITCGGAFTQTPSVSGTKTTLSTAITGANTVTFNGPVSLSGNSSIDTSAVNSNIAFFNTLDDGGNLSLNAGDGGNIVFGGLAGYINRLGALTFVNANDITVLDIKAASLHQQNGKGTSNYLSINTNAPFGIVKNGNNFNRFGSIITTNGGGVHVTNSGKLTIVSGASTLLTGLYLQDGTGPVYIEGAIEASNQSITFNGPMTLTGALALNSDGAGDITISSTIDGLYDLTLVAGDGDIYLQAAVGSVTPLQSLTIVSADATSIGNITAGSITQESGQALTEFHGVVTTNLAGGINLTGASFTFDSPVTTSTGGPVVIAHSDTLTIGPAAAMTLDGYFLQNTSHQVNLAADITTSGQGITFSGPVSLGSNVALDTDSNFGSIVFNSPVNGNYNLTLSSGQGAITANGSIGSTSSLKQLSVTDGLSFTSQSIHAESIHIAAIGQSTTFNGALITTGSQGIIVEGGLCTINSNITTTNDGPLSITNGNTLTIAPSASISLAGAFTQNGIANTYLGGSLSTQAQPILFSGPMYLSGNLLLNSQGGNITFGADLEGPFSVDVYALSGNVTVPAAFSLFYPLQNFTVHSANNISLNGIGSINVPMIGNLTLNASGVINMQNTIYSTHTQYYSSSADLDFIHPGLISLYSNGGNITFGSLQTHLNASTDLLIETSGGVFSFEDIHGTSYENLTINTGLGLASCGAITDTGIINTVLINAGEIRFTGPMEVQNLNCVAQGSIANQGASVDIECNNTASFNSLTHDVGSEASPIWVNTHQQIYAGGDYLAAFKGSALDDTVNVIPSNPPCKIIWNGVVIKDCGRPPVPPVPPTPSPTPTPTPVVIFKFDKPVPGVENSYFTLASDYFFMPYFLDGSYFNRTNLMFYSQPQKEVDAISVL